MGNISWNGHGQNVLIHGVKEKRNITPTIKLDLSHVAKKLPPETQCSSKYKGRIEVMGRRGKRCKQLLDGIKETRKYIM
jgi:hypothetical protein